MCRSLLLNRCILNSPIIRVSGFRIVYTPEIHCFLAVCQPPVKIKHGSPGMNSSSLRSARPLSIRSSAILTPSSILRTFSAIMSAAPAFRQTAFRLAPRCAPFRISLVMSAFSSGVPPASAFFRTVYIRTFQA